MSKEEFEKIKEYATEIKNYHSLPKTDKKVNREEQFLYKMAMEKRAAFDLDIADMTKMSMEQQSAIKQKADYELKNMNDPKIPEDAGFEPL